MDTSEPLLTASVVLLYLALRCGRVFFANAVRRRRGIAPTCSA